MYQHCTGKDHTITAKLSKRLYPRNMCSRVLSTPSLMHAAFFFPLHFWPLAALRHSPTHPQAGQFWYRRVTFPVMRSKIGTPRAGRCTDRRIWYARALRNTRNFFRRSSATWESFLRARSTVKSREACSCMMCSRIVLQARYRYVDSTAIIQSLPQKVIHNL